MHTPYPRSQMLFFAVLITLLIFQPEHSLNGFLASTEGSDIAPEGTGYLGLEPYDVYWSRVRDMYTPFENGMKSGTARVFDHQIPGEGGGGGRRTKNQPCGLSGSVQKL